MKMQTCAKIVAFTAPSGAGKSTIVSYLMNSGFPLEFSISATSRQPRGSEQNGREYYFLTADEFRSKIDAGEFAEYEQVYKGCYYGTLKSEIERIGSLGRAVVMDVDVKGALSIKKLYGEAALTIFVMPPSIDELRRRLEGRGTDSPEKIEERLGRAGYEISMADKFDEIIINADLSQAERQAGELVRRFLSADAD